MVTVLTSGSWTKPIPNVIPLSEQNDSNGKAHSLCLSGITLNVLSLLIS